MTDTPTAQYQPQPTFRLLRHVATTRLHSAMYECEATSIRMEVHTVYTSGHPTDMVRRYYYHQHDKAVHATYAEALAAWEAIKASEEATT